VEVGESRVSFEEQADRLYIIDDGGRAIIPVSLANYLGYSSWDRQPLRVARYFEAQHGDNKFRTACGGVQRRDTKCLEDHILYMITDADRPWDLHAQINVIDACLIKAVVAVQSPTISSTAPQPCFPDTPI